MAAAPTRVERRLALLAVGLVAAAPSALVHGERVVCPIRLMTGRPCPSCGLTRSWHAALRGHLGESLTFHPLGPAALVIAIAYGLAVDERPGPVRDALHRPGVGALGAGVWLATWAVRVWRSG